MRGLRRFAFRLWNPGKWLVLVILSFWLGLAAWICRSGSRTELRKVDCIVVLGARALADGSPGPSLQARCDRALELWRQGWSGHLLFTGGQGLSGTIEGEVGQNYALARGVPRDRIAYEDRSHTTWQNLVEARRIMRARGWGSCLVVTDPFHEPRSLSMARRLELEAYPAPTFSGPAWRHWSTWSIYTFRETLAWVKYRVVPAAEV